MGRTSILDNYNYNKTNIIYHYCSLEIFMTIVKNKTIRMTNIIKSNDYSEITYALKVITDATQRTLMNFMNKNKGNKPLSELIEHFNIDDYFNTLLSESNLLYYAACFSQESDLLSQWRAYADDGNGVAIGFYEPYLKHFSGSEDVSVKYAPISYDENWLRDSVNDFIENRFITISNTMNTGLAKYETVLSDLLTWSIYQAVFFKNPTFSEEHETRLVFYPFGNIRSLRDQIIQGYDFGSSRFLDRMTEEFDYSEGMKRHGDFTRSKPSFLIKGNKLVSYIDFSFLQIAKNFLSEIVLGPKTDTDDSDLRLFMYSNGYDISSINIRKSLIPYI